MTADLLVRPPVPDTVDAATRREFLAMMAAAGLLAACGDDTTSTGAANGEDGTRIFMDDVGRRVEVPVRPQRIVALNDGNGGAQILDLGFSIAGMTTRGGEFNLAFLGADAGEVASATKIGEHSAPNLEAIATLQPDLIVGYTFDKATGEIAFVADSVEDLEAIAPTVFLATCEPIADVMDRFAELLGAEDVAARQRAEFESRLDEVRDVLGSAVERITAASVYHFGDNALRLNGPEISALEQALQALGVAFSDASPPGSEQRDVSAEQMELLEADVLFYHFDPDLSPAARSLFDRLDVVRSGQAVEHANDTVRTFDGLQTALDLVEAVLTRPDFDPDLV